MEIMLVRWSGPTSLPRILQVCGGWCVCFTEREQCGKGEAGGTGAAVAPRASNAPARMTQPAKRFPAPDKHAHRPYPPVRLHKRAAVLHKLAGRGGREGHDGWRRHWCRCTIGRGLHRCCRCACDRLQCCRRSKGSTLQTGSPGAAAQVRRATASVRASRRVWPQALHRADGSDARHTELCAIERAFCTQREMAMREQAVGGHQGGRE